MLIFLEDDVIQIHVPQLLLTKLITRWKNQFAVLKIFLDHLHQSYLNFVVYFYMYFYMHFYMYLYMDLGCLFLWAARFP